MKFEVVISIVLAAAVGFFFKIIWDWLTAGRTEKGVYVTMVQCEKVRDRCSVPQMKNNLAGLDIRLAAAEKSLDRGREDFKLLRKDISGIKESLAGIEAVLRTFLKSGEK